MNLLDSALAIACMMICSLVQADVITPESSRQLAAGCANCHGTQGHARPGLPPLAGMSRSDMVQTMQDYKSDRRKGTVMNQLAKGYEDDEIQALARYFSQQAP